MPERNKAILRFYQIGGESVNDGAWCQAIYGGDDTKAARAAATPVNHRLPN
jgi:hypothetical protein